MTSITQNYSYVTRNNVCRFNYEDLDIKLGTILLDDDDENTVYRQVRRLYVHPEHSLLTLRADLAVLILNETVEFNEFVRPACLPEHNDTFEHYRQCWMTGWGTIGKQIVASLYRFMLAFIVVMFNIMMSVL